MSMIIGTWKMSAAGVAEAYALLRDGASAGDAVVHAVTRVEDDPAYLSVGYGGLPDAQGRVMTDAAFMDGGSLRLGGVMSAENIKNPIKAARLLCGRSLNCLLAGEGAQRFAIENGLEMRDMRTPECLRRWREAIAKQAGNDQAYTGHDTVCVLALDADGHMASVTSTSGLFMKAPGRVGDTPLVGSGFYCDARYGAAAATGLGEDIMRGCLSYEVVSRMRGGESPADACRGALNDLAARLKALGEEPDNISLIALSPDGAFGAATTLPLFPFAVNDKLCTAGRDGGIREVTGGEIDGID